jgi:lipopolysaccharide export system permease protein
MQLIDRLVIKDLVGPFTTGMMMFLLLLFAAAGLFPATELLVQGVKFWTVFLIVMYNLPSLVTQTFPMAMLLAGLLGFGRLSSDREAVAIFAAGISFPRTARFVFVMGAVVSLVAYLWNDLVVPPASTAYNNIRQEAINHLQPSDKPLTYNVPGKDNSGVSEFVSIDGGYDARTQTLRRVSIIKYSSIKERRGQPDLIVYCDHAQFTDQQGLDATYYQGYYMAPTIDPKTSAVTEWVATDFDKIKTLPGATLGKSFAGVISAEITDPNRKTFRELRDEINADRRQGEDTRGKEVDLYGKIALPLASFIFGVVGAALGLNTQRGGGKTVGFGVAIFIVFLYWVFYHAMFVVGKNGGLPPMIASFLADIVGAVVGFILTVRASR